MDTLHFLSAPALTPHDVAHAMLEEARAQGLTWIEMVDMLDSLGYDPEPLFIELAGAGAGGMSRSWWSRLKSYAGQTTRGTFEVLGMGTIGGVVVSVSDALTEALEGILRGGSRGAREGALSSAQETVAAWIRKLPFGVKAEAAFNAVPPWVWVAGGGFLLWRLLRG